MSKKTQMVHQAHSCGTGCGCGRHGGGQPAPDVGAVIQAVHDASRAVGKTIDKLDQRAAEAEREREIAKLDRRLKGRGQVALVADDGAVVGLTSEPYYFAAEAGDHLKELKTQRNKLRAILDHPAASVDEKMHAQVDLDRVQQLIRSLEESANPTDTKVSASALPTHASPGEAPGATLSPERRRQLEHQLEALKLVAADKGTQEMARKKAATDAAQIETLLGLPTTADPAPRFVP